MKRFFNYFKNLFILFSIIILFISSLGISDPGTIYIVIGSDTAIWDGMSPANYNCNYNPALYVDPVTNTSKVMDPVFRGQFKDSFGDTLSITWWMMAGNIFRYAVNNNIPYPNIMTMYLMKEFYGDKIKLLGDELSLHYHTFQWYDYDGDGKYYWNQSQAFMDCYDDFNFTLAQLFLEEEVFPVSYRSGWHYMDNGWQNYLNKLLPYSLHNDYPAKRKDTTEPLDNTYDWSLAPSTFIPYNPSPENYQLPGNSKGWNVRSIHLNNIKNNNTLLNSIFTKADSGINQIVCLWGHLPEEDFNSNIAVIDSVLHKYQSQHPLVKFKYTTGVEAYQYYRGGEDFIKPQLTVIENIAGNSIEYNISTDEPIFQEQPFVAYKDINENFHVTDCISTGINSWKATLPIDKQFIVKAGVVLTDTLGNQAYQIFRYLPDDIIVDNNDPGYHEFYGNWTHNSAYAWKNDSRKASLGENDSAKVMWDFTIVKDGYYHLSTQFPATANHAGKLKFRILSQTGVVDSVFIDAVPPQKEWVYIATKNLTAGNYKIEMTVKGAGQSGSTVTADVIKVSPLVRDKAIYLPVNNVSLGEVSIDSLSFNLVIKNKGIGNLTITEISSTENNVVYEGSLPVIINGLESINLPIKINVTGTGSYTDTIMIKNDDPLQPEVVIPFSCKVIPYFVIVDNEDTGYYFETAGTWAFSVAQAYGPTSRYAYVNQSPRAVSYFEKLVRENGEYDISIIVPTTVNADTNALYRIYKNGSLADSITIDQNLNSGKWVPIKRLHIDANTIVKVEVIDAGINKSGMVLRTDALKIGMVDESLSAEEFNNSPKEFFLYQNYPNPFNPLTVINYQVPKDGIVILKVYDILGNEVTTLAEGYRTSGHYSVQFNASDLASGIYIYRMQAGEYFASRKMILIK